MDRLNTPQKQFDRVALIILYLGWLGKLWRALGLYRLGAALAGLFLLPVSFGIGNVVFSLPLEGAVAHYAGAALLLASMVVINSTIVRGCASD